MRKQTETAAVLLGEVESPAASAEQPEIASHGGDGAEPLAGPVSHEGADENIGRDENKYQDGPNG